MLLNIIIIYLYIFFCTAFILYFAYSVAVVPASDKISKNIINMFESFIFDYAILILVLFIFMILNNSLFHIHHSLFILIQYIVTLSCGVFLASVIAYNLVNHFKMSHKSQIISYILLFMLIFTLYAVLVLFPDKN